MSLRPSKKFFFKMLKRDLSRYTDGTGIDAASADMKNFRFFKTGRYIGIDIDEERLRKGLKKHRDAIGLLADLSLINLPENCADVCVSTHTFEHMPPAAQILMARHLITATRKNGGFLCNKIMDEAAAPIEALLRENFIYVKKIYYRNALSAWFENRFLRYKRGPFLSGIAHFLYLVEHVTCLTPFSNASVYFVCRNKKTTVPEASFDLSGFRVMDTNLWAAL